MSCAPPESQESHQHFSWFPTLHYSPTSEYLQSSVMSLFFVTTSISQNPTNGPPLSGKEPSGASFCMFWVCTNSRNRRNLKTQLFPSDFNRVWLGESVKLRDLAPEFRQRRHQIDMNSGGEWVFETQFPTLSNTAGLYTLYWFHFEFSLPWWDSHCHWTKIQFLMTSHPITSHS